MFSARRAAALAAQPATRQREAIDLRLRRLETVAELGQIRLADLSRQLRDGESALVHNARVVMATMTNVYLSSLLSGDRFDAVIVEEAGMAILPTLFYCAALARSQVIIVGDPRQLPPIVQSSADYVYRAMGRSIFEVTIPDPHHSDIVVMLDTQYRMHPTIGNLISDLFYEGRLRHGENTRERQHLADKQPFAGSPLVVIDTESRTTCATPTGSYSRFNERTAQTSVELAVEAARNGVESVAIITPYVEQSRLIRQQLTRFPAEAARIECRTVHRFQGSERDVVIIDTVDTAPLTPGVLLAGRTPTSSAPNLINVSLSRARGKLIIISDVGYFEKHAPHSVLNVVLHRAMQDGLRQILQP
jgi:superfamily I DNA and/or RNA helicase